MAYVFEPLLHCNVRMHEPDQGIGSLHLAFVHPQRSQVIVHRNGFTCQIVGYRRAKASSLTCVKGPRIGRTASFENSVN